VVETIVFGRSSACAGLRLFPLHGLERPGPRRGRRGQRFEAILRCATRGEVTFSARPGKQETLLIAHEYFSGPVSATDGSVQVNWSSTLDTSWPSRLENVGLAVLQAGHVPGPPEPPFQPGIAYPLAFDVHDGIAAVSFAALDTYPDTHRGWWCLVEQFALDDDGTWRHAGGAHDNTTTPTPFQRPTHPQNSRTAWIDWRSDGGRGEWDAHPMHRHSYFGTAPTTTDRLTVTTDDDRTRDVAITPWSGAWIVVAPGTASTLTGYDATGAVLGTTTFGTRHP
jgi:hypothetical protein